MKPKVYYLLFKRDKDKCKLVVSELRGDTPHYMSFADRNDANYRRAKAYDLIFDGRLKKGWFDISEKGFESLVTLTKDI